jgi:amino acid transporter
MPFDIRPLLTLSFWFDANPPALLSFFEKGFFILYLAALVCAMVLARLEKRSTTEKTRRVLLGRFRRLAATVGFVGLILLFFSYERAPYLSMRALTGLLLIGALVWKVLILRWWFRAAPGLRNAEQEKREFRKYLPR